MEYEIEIASAVGSYTDYYTYMDTWAIEYFKGIIAKYPFRRWSAYRLVDYVSSGSSQNNAVYKLYYNYRDNDTQADYIQLTKPYSLNGYNITRGRQTISLPNVNTEIVYGNYGNLSDFSGVNYVSDYGIPFALSFCLVLYVFRNLFRFIMR